MINKIIPFILKKKFKNLILRITDNDSDITSIEKRLNRLSSLINSLYPEKIIYSPEMDLVFENFCKEKNISSLNKSIAKNDLMFHYCLFLLSNKCNPTLLFK